MRLSDIVDQLRIVLPKYTNEFSTTVGVTSIDSTNNISTIVTSSAHNLQTGDEITLQGYYTQTSISNVSQDGLVFTFTTATDHDLTESYHETITLGGFDATNWNGSYSLLEVPNRRTFKIRTTESIPSLSSNEYVLEQRIDGVNGQYSTTVIDNTTLQISGNFLDGSYVNGTLNSVVRVVGSLNIERFIEKYSEQNITNMYICVSLNDSDVSKDRNTYSDAVASPVNGSELRLTMINSFTIYVLVNTSKDITAVEAVDKCNHTLLLPILKSIYGVKFPTGLTNETDYKTISTGHGTAIYNKAVYVHAYNFEMSMEMVSDDAVDASDSRAFRDINYTHTVDERDLTLTIDLDDEPLDR